MPLIKKAYFPRTILPLSALISNIIHLCFAFIVLIVLFAIWRVDVNIHYLLVIPATLLAVLFTYGLSAMLAAWSVFYADVKFIVGNLLGLWFFLTPVLYRTSSVLGADLMGAEQGPPDNWLEIILHNNLVVFKQLFLLDPLTWAIEGYRSALLEGGASPIADPQYPAAPYIVGASLIAVATCVVGQIIFRRKAAFFAEQG
jgi:ABC-type polysaccharide/polyol phosphate export permease